MSYWKLTINILISFVLLGLACTREVVVAGRYEVGAKSAGDRILLRQTKSESRIIGSKLNLDPDSAFLYLTCGNQMTGHWARKGDSVLLYVATNVYRTDSMRAAGPAVISPEPICFHVRQRQLWRVWKTADSLSYMEILTKIE